MMAQIINTILVCLAGIVVFLGFTHERKLMSPGSTAMSAGNQHIYKEKRHG